MSNVEKFFALYDGDGDLRAKVSAARDAYPGSLEVKDSVAEFVLLPIAEELGLPFTLQELRGYETKKKLSRRQADEPIPEGEPEEDPAEYWLLDGGWEWQDSRETKRNALLKDIAEGWIPPEGMFPEESAQPDGKGEEGHE